MVWSNVYICFIIIVIAGIIVIVVLEFTGVYFIKNTDGIIYGVVYIWYALNSLNCMKLE